MSPENVIALSGVTPTERIQNLASIYNGSSAREKSISKNLHEALTDYSDFLELIHGNAGDPEKVVSEDGEVWRKRSYEFGEKLANAMTEIAGSKPLANDLYRMVLI